MKVQTVPIAERERQLLCVVFADMAGYSALTSKDETGTHTMWMRFVGDVLQPKSDLYGGNVVRLLGDGVLLTFQSTTAALDWAISVQTAITEARVGKTAPYPGLSLRIAAHICEAILDGDDVYGDGVNITKRLQESIAPDGIIISEDMYHSTRQAMDFQVRGLGLLTLKNIGHPVRAYEVVRAAAEPSVGLLKADEDLPSLAVLPMRNLSGDEDFKYFCDGVVEDIITSLSSMRELLVISRASALALGDADMDPREVGRILDVKYVLQGSLRRSATKMRLSVSLCDTTSGKVLFSSKSEFPHSDIFETQDRIVEHVVSYTAPNVRSSERVKALRKPPDNFTAYDLTLKALDLMTGLNKTNFDTALKHLKAAMELDPEFAMPVAYAARWHCIYVGQGWDDDREEYVRRAQDYAALAVKLDRQNALALAAYGHVKAYLQRDYEQALVFLDRAREMGPSQALSWILSSGTLSYVGRPLEAIEHAEHGIRLSPNDPDLFQYYDFLAIAHYCNGDFGEASKWCDRSYAEKQDYTSNWRMSAACHAAAGNKEKAVEFAKRLLDKEPDFDLARYQRDRVPFRGLEPQTQFVQHLKSAGLR